MVSGSNLSGDQPADANNGPSDGPESTSEVQLGDETSIGTTGSMECVRPLDTSKTTVVAYKPGAVGLRLRWSDMDNAFAIQEFPRLPSGEASVAEACGVLFIGMILRCAGKKVLVGLSQEEVVELLAAEVEGKEEEEVLLEFGQGSEVALDKHRGYSGDEADDGEAFLHRVARSIEEELRHSSSIWNRYKIHAEGSKGFVRVSIRNKSPFHAIRHFLRRRFEKWVSVERQALGSRWTARIKRLKLSTDPRVPFTHDTYYVGSFRSKDLAMRAARRALKKRDSGRLPLLPPPGSLLCATKEEVGMDFLVSHLAVCIESDRFRYLSCDERLQVSWEAIMRCRALRPFLVQPTIEEFYKIAFLSSQCRSLQCFSFLGLNLSIECRADEPQQNSSRIAIRGAPKKLLAKLRAAQKKTDSIVYREMSSKELRHMLDKRIEPEGDGPFSHVYHSLTERFNFDEGPRHGNDWADTPPEHILDAAKHKYVNAALILQRVYRARFQFKLVRWWFMQVLRSIYIQKWYRGTTSRYKTLIWAAEVRAATCKIQATWRMATQFRIAKKIRRGITLFQAVIRGGIRRHLMELARRYHLAIIDVQRIIRGRLARIRFEREKDLHYFIHTLLPAATAIQRVIRGRIGRNRAKHAKELKYYNEVYLPSVITIQSLERRRLGIGELQLRKKRYAASAAIQRIARGVIDSRRAHVLAIERHRARAATKISQTVRGYQCRMLYGYLERHVYFETRVLGAVTTIQARWKGRQMRAAFKVLVYQDMAVSVIQTAWRGYRAKRKCRDKIEELRRLYKSKLITRMQAAYRGFSDRKTVEWKKRQRLAERIEASVAVQQWWRWIRSSWLRRLEKLHWEIEDLHLRTRDAITDVSDLKDDLEDVYGDRKRLRKARRRLERARKRLKEEGIDMQRRLPEVEQELELLGDAEEDPHMLGWKDAYETEWDILTNTIEMIREDRISSKVKMEELDVDLEDLQIEAEGLEVEIDVYTESAFALEQNLHCKEIHFALWAFDTSRRKAITRQQHRWQIKSRRRKVIARRRGNGEELLHLIQDEKQRLLRAQHVAKSEAQSIRDKLVAMAEVERCKRRLEDLERKQSERLNPPAIQETYGEIIKKVNRVVMQLSFDVRRPKRDHRSDPKITCQTCGKVLMVCKCEEEEEDDLEF